MINVVEVFKDTEHELVETTIVGSDSKVYGIAGSSIIILPQDDGTVNISATTPEEALNVTGAESLRIIVDSFFHVDEIDVSKYQQLAFGDLSENSALRTTMLSMGAKRLNQIVDNPDFDPTKLSVQVLVNGHVISYAQFDDIVATMAHDAMEIVFNRINFTGIRAVIDMRARAMLQQKANAVIERMADLSDQLADMSVFIEEGSDD